MLDRIDFCYFRQDLQDLLDLFFSSLSCLQPVGLTPRRDESDEVKSAFGGGVSYFLNWLSVFAFDFDSGWTEVN